MANQAVKAVKEGDLKIIPSSYEKIWFEWLENIQDWCLSRQLWWGHRIPAYKNSENGEWVVKRALEDAQKHFGTNKEIIQDEDVLDTWFSSALFPFHTLGWPNEENKDFKHFFPGTLLETGHDIIFFWVARMVMMSIALTGKLPFKEVYLNPIVRDQDGKKMSKSLGNVIDPLQVIDGCTLEELQEAILNSSLTAKEIKRGVNDKKKQFPNGIPPCGSDALRFSLLSYMIQPRSININPNVIVSYRLFNNKLWNASKFILSQVPTNKQLSLSLENKSLSLIDQWIIIKLDSCARKCNQALEDYKFGEFARSFEFTNDLWLYLEVSKRQIADNYSDQCQIVLLKCLDHLLKLLAPALPYITEEIYQHLNIAPKEKFESLCIAEYPQSVDLSDINVKSVKEEAEFLLDISQRIRSILGQLNASKYTAGSKEKIEIYISSENQKNLLLNNSYVIEALTGTSLTVLSTEDPTLDTLNQTIEFSPGFSSICQFDIKDTINMAEEGRNLEQNLEKIEKYQKSLQNKLNNPNFSKRAPQDVVEEARSKLQDSKEKEKVIRSILKLI